MGQPIDVHVRATGDPGNRQFVGNRNLTGQRGEMFRRGDALDPPDARTPAAELAERLFALSGQVVGVYAQSNVVSVTLADPDAWERLEERIAQVLRDLHVHYEEHRETAPT